jgi:hypothetical protein
MIWPNICVDNFFNNPEEIVKYANSLEYSPHLKSPGIKSEPLHTVDSDFFTFVNFKILSVIYPHQYRNLEFNASTYFVKVPPNFPSDGWVHDDAAEGFGMTSIVYLSKNLDAGTCIYKKKTTWKQSKIDQQIKHDHFANFHKNILNKDIEKYKKENNSFYEETIRYKSVYNRLISFDASSLHAAVPYIDKHSKEDRLTLISFFTDIRHSTAPLKYPLPESRRL